MRLIDADALLESYDVAWMYEYDETGCGVRRKAIPIKCVEDSPTIEAEPVRHGEWIYHHAAPEGWKVCSVCLSQAHHPAGGDPCCHNCGAKMDGGGEE